MASTDQPSPSTSPPFSILLNEGILRVVFSKPPDIEQFCKALDTVVARGDNRLRLWDFSCGAMWTARELRGIASYARATIKTPESKIAIFAPDDHTFSLFQIHNILREDECSEQRVFREEQDALGWLMQENNSSPK
jgi:hypothetical protein